MSAIRILIILFLSMLVGSCAAADEIPSPTIPKVALTDTPASTSEIVRDKAERVIEALRDRDLDLLSGLVHPTLGIRFSPYAFVREADVTVTVEDVPNLFSDDTVLQWGVYDGSGVPIELTFAQYYQQFIYDQDFANAEEIGYDRRIGGEGGTINNIPDYYPGGVMVEYHFSGFEPDYGGLDWRSLRLVFVQDGDEWFLVGIVHDEWTT
ncbi:MAG: hypothetical protein WBB65_14125 [Anaerolineales bacterium]